MFPRKSVTFLRRSSISTQKLRVSAQKLDFYARLIYVGYTKMPFLCIPLVSTLYSFKK